MKRFQILFRHFLYFPAMLITLTAGAQPSITTFSPTSGAIGTTVTINGSGFDPSPTNNVVYFGAVKAAVLSASATTLTVSAPAGATFQPLSVLNLLTHLAASASRAFVTTFPNPAGQGITAAFYQNRTDIRTASGQLPYFISVGDLDGDGKANMAVANSASNTVSVFRNTSASPGISFADRVDFVSGDGPNSVAIADIDGDGKPDLVVVNERSNSVSIFRNTSSAGSFSSASLSAPMSFTTGDHPYSVAISDFDGDGRPDLVVANAQSNTISVLRNTSSSGTITASSFAPRTDIATGLNPRFVAAGDIDGDGKPDIAVVNQQSATLSLLRNTATSGLLDASSFVTKVDFGTGDNPIGVSLGDLDGDGRQDLAVANSVTSSISVFRNTATPGTLTTTSLSTKADFSTSVQPFGLALGDADGDGKVDIAVANSVSGNLSILRNTATAGSIVGGSFAASIRFSVGGYPLSVALADLDGDGVPEALGSNGASSTITILKTISPHPVVTGFSPGSGRLGSTVTITGSVFNSTPGANTVFFGSVKAPVTGGFANSLTVTVPAGANYQPITVLNSSNGLAGYSAQPFRLTFPNPFGTGVPQGFYNPKTDFATGTLPYTMAFGDLDGDGKPDMVAVNGNQNTISVYRNAASGNIAAGTFAGRFDIAVGSEPRAIAIADVDGDGNLDLIVTNSGASTVSVIKNMYTSGILTTTSFAGPVDFVTGDHPYSVAVQDLDNDGRPELVTADLFSNTISVLKNTGSTGNISSGSFASPISLAVGDHPRSVALGDLDGDGKIDIAVANQEGATISVLRNQFSGSFGAGSFAARTDFTTGSSPQGLVIGDLDGDNKLDLAVVNFGSNSVSVLRNTATAGAVNASSFAPKTDISTGPGPFALAIGDADGDGKPDLLTSNTGNSSFTVLRNTIGGGSTSVSFDRTDFSTGGYPVFAAFEDINADGQTEVATANAASNTISIFEIAGTATVGPPVITSVQPGKAPQATAITITGSKFNPVPASNTVFFGAVMAQVTGGSGTTLNVSVPAGATFEPVTVLNNSQGLSATSSIFFNRTFTNPFGSAGIPANFYKPHVDIAYDGRLPFTQALGDIDGDGKADLVVGDINGTGVTVYRNTSVNGTVDAGSLTKAANFSTNGNPAKVLVKDVDNDGKPDIVAANLSSGTFSILRNTSIPGTINSTSFAVAVTFTFANNSDPYAIALGDVDGDGRPDIAVATSRVGRFDIYKNNTVPGTISATSFPLAVIIPTSNTIRDIMFGDMDGDGRQDLVALNEGASGVVIFRNTGFTGGISGASFTTSPTFGTGNDPFTLALGDLNSDGRLDVMTTNYGSNTVSVMRNNSSPGLIDVYSLVGAWNYIVGAKPYMGIIADADGDGKPDIITVNSGASTITVLRSIANPGAFNQYSFPYRTDYATGGYPVSLSAGDIDGDGLTDVITGNAASQNISILSINAGASATASSLSALLPAATAAADLAEASLQVFPNPTSGNLTLLLTGLNTGSAQVDILNRNGQIVEKRTLSFAKSATQFTQTLSLRNRPPGEYFIKLTTTQGVQIAKVVIQR